MITRSVWLRVDQARAFTLFTERVGAWWPPDRRHTGDPNSAMFLEPSGRFWERGADGREVDLGRVRAWEPPRRLVLDFFAGTGVDHPTRVIVSFLPEEDGTRVHVEHGPTEHSAHLWSKRVAVFEASWSSVLAALELASR